MRIVVSGGGTGGHIFPTIAVIEALKAQHPLVEILYIGERGGMEEKILPPYGVQTEFIRAGKLRRYHPSKLKTLLDVPTNLLNARDVLRVVEGFSKSLAILQREKPSAVFLKGGYVSLPVGLAAAALKIPMVLHESDAVPGLANRLLARFAETICISFHSLEGLPEEKLVFTGNPVRPEIGSVSKEAARRELKLESGLKTVFIFGGSQGAHAINSAVREALPELLKEAQIIHASGEQDHAWLDHERSKLEMKHRYRLYSFLREELPLAFSAADLIVARAGGAVFEIAAVGKPSILIPLALPGSDQTKNAQEFSRAGAALVIPGDRLTPESLAGAVRDLLLSEEKLKEMGQCARTLAAPDAAKKIAGIVLALGRTHDRRRRLAS